MLLDNSLDMSHLRTGGINDFDSSLFDLISLRRGYAVGPDYDRGPFSRGRINIVDTTYRDDSSCPQELNSLGIVNQRTISIDIFFSFALSNVEDEIDGPSHAHTKSRCLGKFDTHMFCKIF